MIDDPCSIDAIGFRKDGGADLQIVSSGPLDDSPETQDLLLDKIEGYLSYINSAEFRAERPRATVENTHIILRLEERPPASMGELFQKIASWTAAYNASFFAEVRERKERAE